MPYTITTFGLLIYFLCVALSFFFSAANGHTLQVVEALAAVVTVIGILFRR